MIQKLDNTSRPTPLPASECEPCVHASLPSFRNANMNCKGYFYGKCITQRQRSEASKSRKGSKEKGRKEAEHFLHPLEKHSRTIALYHGDNKRAVASGPVDQRQQRKLEVLKFLKPLRPSNGHRYFI